MYDELAFASEVEWQASLFAGGQPAFDADARRAGPHRAGRGCRPGWTTCPAGWRARTRCSPSWWRPFRGASGRCRCTTGWSRSHGWCGGGRRPTAPAPLAHPGPAPVRPAPPLRPPLRLGGVQLLPDRRGQRGVARRPDAPGAGGPAGRHRQRRSSPALPAATPGRWPLPVLPARPRRPAGHGWRRPARLGAHGAQGRGGRSAHQHHLPPRCGAARRAPWPAGPPSVGGRAEPSPPGNRLGERAGQAGSERGGQPPGRLRPAERRTEGPPS